MPRKGENIYRRKDGRWEARYIESRDENGKPKYKAVYARTYREVKKKRNEALAKLEKLGYPGQPKAGTVASVARSWLKDSAHKWKESTLCRYREKVEIYIIPEFGDRELSDISTDEVERFLTRIQTEGLEGRNPVGSSVAGMVLTIFNQIRLHALRSDCLVRFSPEALSVKRKKTKVSVFTENEEKKLIRELKTDTDETDAGILVSLFTGIRIGELCALNCNNIDLEEGVLHVTETMQRLPDDKGGDKKTAVKIDTPKSSCSVRDIPLGKGLVKVIREFYKPGAFFLTGDKEKFVEPRVLEDRYHKILKDCGIKRRTYHTTRHTFATRCIERGMDVKTLSELLGHASVATTMDLYVYLSMKHKAKSMELLADLMED